MKREILCPECWKEAFTAIVQGQQVVRADAGPQGKWRFVGGDLRIDCHCDHCNKPLECGDRVEAVTIWIGDEPQRWEQEYMLVHGED